MSTNNYRQNKNQKIQGAIHSLYYFYYLFTMGAINNHSYIIFMYLVVRSDNNNQYFYKCPSSKLSRAYLMNGMSNKNARPQCGDQDKKRSNGGGVTKLGKTS